MLRKNIGKVKAYLKKFQVSQLYPQKYPIIQHESIGEDIFKVNFPQAKTDFKPPLFYPTEVWTGSRWGMMELKNAFQVLYRTLNMLDYSVNEYPNKHADIIFDWSGKHIGYQTEGKILIMEHGWIPRWSYQISDLGTNSRGHYARYKYHPLKGEERGYVINYLEKLLQIYKNDINWIKVEDIKKNIKEPFILFPFQLATDFNLKYSKTQFAQFYSKNSEKNVLFAQACIDHIEETDISLPVIFKQHPMDPIFDLIKKLKLRNMKNILLKKDKGVSTHELFATGLCKLVIGINSNTLHEAAVWNIPSISLGTLIWDNLTNPKPFSADIEEAERLIGTTVISNKIILAYMYHLIKNQWFLSDFQNPLIVREILRTEGRCESFATRKKYSLLL